MWVRFLFTVVAEFRLYKTWLLTKARASFDSLYHRLALLAASLTSLESIDVVEIFLRKITAARDLTSKEKLALGFRTATM